MSEVDFQQGVLDLCRALSGFGINWLLQSTMLIMCGLVAAKLLRRRGSAVQSAIYRTTLAAIVLCPVTGLFPFQVGLKGWSVDLPPAYAMTDAPTEEATNSEEARAPNVVSGRVFNESNASVAGAKVWWFRSRVHDIDPMKPVLVATSDDAGQFSFTRPKMPDPKTEPASWDFAERLIIRADVHAVLRSYPNSRTGHQMERPGKPLRGRIVDIDGQPVAGATLRIRRFEPSSRRAFPNAQASNDEEAQWRARVNHLLNVIEPVPQRFVYPSATTNENGEFELSGIGKDWLLQLLLEGDGIQSTDILAFNGSNESRTISPGRGSTAKPKTVYGNGFLFAAGPSKLVTGVVTDLDNGDPIPNAVVRAFFVYGERVHSSRERQHFATRTDKNGHYKISGLPIGKSNALVAFTTDNDTPYFPTSIKADTSQDSEQIEANFGLRRGVWAEGRITNGSTGEPFTGEVSYHWFRNKDLEVARPGIRDQYLDGRYWTNIKGEFRIPVLPTRGILAYRWDGDALQNPRPIDRFPRGLGAAAINGIDERMRSFPTEPMYIHPGNYNFVLEVTPQPGQEVVRADMTLTASKPIQIQIVGADDESIPDDGYLVYNLNERWGWKRDQSHECVVEDLKPGEHRKVFVYHRERQLGGAAIVHEDIEQPVKIELVKTGRVKGRLLDKNGDVITDGSISVAYEKLLSNEPYAIWASHPTKRAMPSVIPADENGNFELDGFIPGWKYSARVNAPRKMSGRMTSVIIGMAFVDLEIQPGETKDIGEVKAVFPKRDNPEDQEGSHSAAERQ